MTEWREIPGWEGLYAASDDGQVKSLPRPRRKAERVLAAQREHHRPYWYVTLWIGKKPHHRRVHDLVLEAFAGVRPEGLSGLHADDDPDNNHLDNLRWGTPRSNFANPQQPGPRRVLARTCKACGLFVPAGCFDKDRTGSLRRTCKRCRREAHKEWARQPASVVKRRAYEQRYNSVKGPRLGLEWTGPELELLERKELTARAIAEMTGRTVLAVKIMRVRLRREPKLQRVLGPQP